MSHCTQRHPPSPHTPSSKPLLPQASEALTILANSARARGVRAQSIARQLAAADGVSLPPAPAQDDTSKWRDMPAAHVPSGGGGHSKSRHRNHSNHNRGGVAGGAAAVTAELQQPLQALKEAREEVEAGMAGMEALEASMPDVPGWWKGEGGSQAGSADANRSVLSLRSSRAAAAGSRSTRAPPPPLENVRIPHTPPAQAGASPVLVSPPAMMPSTPGRVEDSFYLVQRTEDKAGGHDTSSSRRHGRRRSAPVIPSWQAPGGARPPAHEGTRPYAQAQQAAHDFALRATAVSTSSDLGTAVSAAATATAPATAAATQRTISASQTVGTTATTATAKHKLQQAQQQHQGQKRGSGDSDMTSDEAVQRLVLRMREMNLLNLSLHKVRGGRCVQQTSRIVLLPAHAQ